MQLMLIYITSLAHAVGTEVPVGSARQMESSFGNCTLHGREHYPGIHFQIMAQLREFDGQYMLSLNKFLTPELENTRNFNS